VVLPGLSGRLSGLGGAPQWGAPSSNPGFGFCCLRTRVSLEQALIGPTARAGDPSHRWVMCRGSQGWRARTVGTAGWLRSCGLGGTHRFRTACGSPQGSGLSLGTIRVNWVVMVSEHPIGKVDVTKQVISPRVTHSGLVGQHQYAFPLHAVGELVRRERLPETHLCVPQDARGEQVAGVRSEVGGGPCLWVLFIYVSTQQPGLSKLEVQMSWTSKSIRFAVAGVLALSVLAVSESAQAAEPTGSLVADGNGGVTATFAGGTPPAFTGLLIFDAPATCPTSSDELLAARYGLPLAGATSPVTLTTGTLVVTDITTPDADTPLPAGSYQFCLTYLDFSSTNLVLASLEAVIGSAPTTTTTAAPTTTTTAAPAAPATPRFTG
jgi:hypothetical protein